MFKDSSVPPAPPLVDNPLLAPWPGPWGGVPPWDQVTPGRFPDAFERAMAEDSVNAQKQLFEPVASVEAVDETTVVITLKRPTGHFLFNLGWGDMVIVEPSSAETNKTEPVGTGPFRFSRWVTGDRVELVRRVSAPMWGSATGGS